MKRILSGIVVPIAFICLFFLSAHAEKTPAPAAQKTVDQDWVLKADTAGVKAYYMITTCDGSAVVYLKFVNSNSVNAKIAWTDLLKLSGKDSPLRAKTFSPSITCAPGELVGSNCADPNQSSLVVKWTGSSNTVIESYLFQDFAVTLN